MKSLIDIGSNHSIEFVAYEGDDKTAVNVHHQRSDGSACVGFVPFKGGKWASEFETIATWDVQSWEPLTLSPSILCRACKDHGFIRNGRWESA